MSGVFPLFDDFLLEGYFPIGDEPGDPSPETQLDNPPAPRKVRSVRAPRPKLILPPPPVVPAFAGRLEGRRSALLCRRLVEWAEKSGQGVVFGPMTEFTLRNGVKRAPGASWVGSFRWNILGECLQDTGPLTPDFVVEFAREGIPQRALRAMMLEYIASGVELAWLIDPKRKRADVYRPGHPMMRLAPVNRLDGGSVLPGFSFFPAEIW